MAETRRKIYEARRASLNREQSTWIDHWRDISTYILPRRGRYLNPRAYHNIGTKKNDSIKNGIATQAAATAASGMKAGLSSKSRRWFVLGTVDSELQEWGPVKYWLHQAEKLLYAIFAGSNFYDALTPVYEEHVTFGTAAMHIAESPATVIHCFPHTIGSYTIALGAELKPDTIYRLDVMTAAQMVQKFGEDKVSDAVKNAWKLGDTEQTREIIHIIEPNDDRIEGRADWRGKPYRSVYYDPQDDEERFLRESGYWEFPCAIPRWWVTAQDVYGTSAGMVALPDVRQLQKDTKSKGRHVELLSNPPWTAPVELKRMRISTVPGDVTFVPSAMAGAQFTPAYKAPPNINPQLQNLAELEQRIEKAFYVDIFKMIASRVSPQMTATQVLELANERMILLGPVVEKAETELLDVAIMRTLAIAMRNGLLPPPPQELIFSGYDVQYISLLSLAQKASGIQGLQDTADFVGRLAQVFPEAVTKFDSRQAIDEFAQMNAIPPGVIRTDEQVAEIDAQQQRQEQAIQLLAMAQQGADIGKTLSETQVGQRSALDALAGTTGAAQGATS